MAPKTTRKVGTKASKGSDQPNSKAETYTEAIATAKADSDNASMNSSAEAHNEKRHRVSTATNGASDTSISSSASVVTANTSAGVAGGEDARTSGVPSDMISLTTIEAHAAEPRFAAAAGTASPIAMEVYGDGDGDRDAGCKVGGGTGAMHVPCTALPHGLEIIPSEAGSVTVAVTAVATYESLISGMARANGSNIFTAENYYLLHWLYHIRNVSCLRDLRISFLQPDFLWSIYGPMMRSRKLWRTDGDIKVAADLWCFDRAAAEELYGHISDWDVSSVTDMRGLFQGPHPYVPMQDSYRGKDLFNDDIGRWDVSNVTDLSLMFAGAQSFNQPVGDWNVSKVTNMRATLAGAGSFNQPVGNWDVSKVTDRGMFRETLAFNQPVGDWDVSKVTDMSLMFLSAVVFDQDLTRWDMSSVGNADNMFGGAHAMQRHNKPAAVRDDVYEDSEDSEGDWDEDDEGEWEEENE